MLLTKPEKFALLSGVVEFIFLILLTVLMPDDQASQNASFHSKVRRRKAWSIEGGRLLLGLPDSPIQDKKWHTLYLSRDSGLTGAAIEKCESPLQFFVLVEKNTLKGLGDYKDVKQLFANKIAYDKNMENIRESALLCKKVGIAALLSWMLAVLMWVSKEPIKRYNVKRHKSRCSRKGMVYSDRGGDYQLHVAAIEEFKLLLQLFVLVEKYALIGPGQLEYLTKIMHFSENIAIFKDNENYPALLSPMLFIPMFCVPKLVDPIQASNRYEVKRRKSLSSDEGRLMLRISDSLSRDERDQFTSYLNGGDSPLPVAAIEECKSLLQLFVLMEKYPLNGQRDPEYPLISPGHLEDFTQIMQSIGKDIAIVKEIKNYLDAGHMPDLPKYKMDRLPRGLCIIFNGENFTSKELGKRLGTQKDVEALLNTFQNNLRFKTKVKNDPTAEEYIDYLQAIGRMDHSEFDCFVCIILSHGRQGRVYGKNGGEKYIDALTGLFRGDYVPSLVNKPKLFFIQACQGPDAQGAVDIQQDATATLPKESDTLVSMSTVPGYASNRSVSQGTWFITSLCIIINSYYKENVDLLSMLTMVNEMLSKAADKENGKQIGNPSHTLRKQIYFNQGVGD